MEETVGGCVRVGVVPRLPIPTLVTPSNPITSPPSSGRSASSPIPIPGAKAQKSPIPKTRQ